MCLQKLCFMALKKTRLSHLRGGGRRLSVTPNREGSRWRGMKPLLGTAAERCGHHRQGKLTHGSQDNQSHAALACKDDIRLGCPLRSPHMRGRGWCRSRSLAAAAMACAASICRRGPSCCRPPCRRPPSSPRRSSWSRCSGAAAAARCCAGWWCYCAGTAPALLLQSTYAMHRSLKGGLANFLHSNFAESTRPRVASTPFSAVDAPCSARGLGGRPLRAAATAARRAAASALGARSRICAVAMPAGSRCPGWSSATERRLLALRTPHREGGSFASAGVLLLQPILSCYTN